MTFSLSAPVLKLLQLVKKLHLPLSGLPALRATIHMLDRLYKLPPDLTLEEINLAGVRVEKMRRPSSSSATTIFYLHGGAFIIGLNCLYRQFADILTELTPATVLLIDYGVAPENPFPIGLNQCVAAYKALLHQGVDPNDIIFMGDSAGGGLVLSTMLAARDQHLPMPKAAVVFSPWVDLTLSHKSLLQNEEVDPIIPAAHMKEVVAMYLKDHPPADPLASPLFGDLQALPPLFISLGTHEVLWDECQLLAKKAKAAGIKTILDVGKGMIHVYPLLMPTHPQSRATLDKLKSFMSL